MPNSCDSRLAPQCSKVGSDAAVDPDTCQRRRDAEEPAEPLASWAASLLNVLKRTVPYRFTQPGLGDPGGGFMHRQISYRQFA